MAIPYTLCIRRTLDACLCLQNFPCQIVERHNKPEIEVQTSPELILKPVTICKNDSERCLIETSINSVRVSFKWKIRDTIEELLKKTFIKMLLQRAEMGSLSLLRRVPIDGYDISFLITNYHMQDYGKSLARRGPVKLSSAAAIPSAEKFLVGIIAQQSQQEDNIDYQKSKLLDFICKFVEDFASEISELRLLANQRSRAVGVEVARSFAEGVFL